MSCPAYQDEDGGVILLDPRQANLVRTVLAMAAKGRRLKSFQVTLHVHGASVGWGFLETGSLDAQISSTGGAYNLKGGAA